MILDALRVLLFGMLGIFLVMAIIFGVIVLLSRISAWSSKNADGEAIPIDVESDPVPDEAVEVISDNQAGEQYFVGDEYSYGEYADAAAGEYSDGVEYVEEWSELDPNADYEMVEVVEA